MHENDRDEQRFESRREDHEDRLRVRDRDEHFANKERTDLDDGDDADATGELDS